MRDVSCRAATPELMVPLPREVPPSKKAIEPVGLPEFAVTVAVRVTAWLVVAGLGEAASEVVVVAAAGALTVSATLEDAEAAKSVLPAYCAVRL